MIDIINIRGKEIIFIDEISFGFPLDLGSESRDCIDFSFLKREKLGERMMY